MARARTATRTRLGVERLDDRITPATLPAGFTETAVAAGLSNATAMEVAPNGDLWVLEQGGGVKRFRPGSTAADLVGNLSAVGLRSEGERGVLGIAFDPNYATNKWVYIYYTSSDAPNPHNRVSRFTVSDATAADYSFVDTDAGVAGPDETVILDLDLLSAATNHNGGAIHFGPDGKLYIAVGDNAAGANAQSLANRHGKVLRINADGTIPADNPTAFAGIAGTTTGANRAIWAVGLRNPYTFAFRPGTGEMFINDVGQGTWEEVNRGGAGLNYGWPTTEGAFNSTTYPSFTQPVYAYSHGSGTFQGYAITGGAFYNPATSQFPARYQGDYFFADYVNSWINVLDTATGTVERFASSAPATVDLRVAADGSLLYLARGSNQVFRVSYTASSAPAVTQQPANATVTEGGNATFTVAASGTAPLSYQWQKLVGSTWTNLANGADFSGVTTATLTVLGAAAGDAGQYRAVVSNTAGTATSTAATLTVTANRPPAASIALPAGLTNGKFVAGQTVTFSGTATDPEDGTLGAAAYTWKVEYLSSTATGTPAVRPFVPEFGGATGGTFTPATSGPYTLTDVAYRVTLTVRDSAGLTTTTSTDVLPNVASITLASAPAGLTLTLDGQPYTAPTTVQSVVGFERPIGAAATQTVGGTTYTFQGWSDGGAATHTIVTPAAATTYTATYAAVALFSTRINFQLAGAPVPAGYLADTGAVFGNRGNGYSYGWNANNASTARDRNAANSPDQRYDTLIHLQKPENPNAVWELAVPNGTYRVRLVAGDPSHTDSVYRTTAEGVLAISGTPTSAQRWFDNTVTVTVTDGRLTLANGAGAQNNKLAFVEVTQVGGLPAGLVGEYRFNENAGTATADGSASANGGTLVGSAVWVGGRSGAGSAVAFDGSGRVDVAADLNAWLGASGTVAFWLRTTQVGNNTMWLAPGVLGVESAGDGNDVFWGWLDASGRIGVQAGDVAGARSATPVNDGQWHHVALTRDHTTGRVEVYVDGTLSGSATSGTGVKTTPFRSIGRIDDTGGTPTGFACAVDDLLVFNRVLTADEIRGLA
jgi:glucose/arabinose dehydrogenase